MSDEQHELGRRPSPPIINAPAAVKWLAGIIIAVHLLRLALPDAWDFSLVEMLAFDSSVYTDAGTGQVKPAAAILGPLGHMLLHADFLHLGVNMGLFLAFGAAIARRMSGIWFIIFFLVCGLAGAAAWFVMHPNSPALLIGASGAISGTIGAIARLGLGRGPARGGPMPFRNRRTALNFAGVWILLNFLFGAIGGQLFGVDAEIAWEAHLGGFVAGFLLMRPVDGRGLPPWASGNDGMRVEPEGIERE